MEKIRRFLTEHHPVHEDFKVFHHRADRSVDMKDQRVDSLLFVDLDLLFGHGVVDAIVDIEIRLVLVPDARPSDIALVGEDQRGA